MANLGDNVGAAEGMAIELNMWVLFAGCNGHGSFEMVVIMVSIWLWACLSWCCCLYTVCDDKEHFLYMMDIHWLAAASFWTCFMYAGCFGFVLVCCLVRGTNHPYVNSPDLHVTSVFALPFLHADVFFASNDDNVQIWGKNNNHSCLLLL